MKRYIPMMLAMLALAACNKNVGPETPTPVYGNIQVEPVITRATEVNFEDGDKIGLTVLKGTETYADNAQMTYAGNVFTGSTLWYTQELDESVFLAYYPYDAAGTPSVFSPATDQTAGITSSDFMAAKKEGVLPSYNAVSMVFKHMMTKIVVNITNESGSPVTAVEIGGLVPSAAIDLENLQTVPSDVAATAAVKAYESVPGATYCAIVAPQTSSLVVALTVGGNKTTRKLLPMTLKQGGQYTVNVEVVAGDVTISASGEIENWTDEGEIGIDDGAAVEPEEGEYVEYAGVKYKVVTLADGNTWMAENLRYVPEGKTVSSDATEDAGIWYPATNADKVADPALAETLGLLYDAATAFGVDEITIENAGTFEGCRGICPEGWHIPTVTDMTGLVGHHSNGDLIDPDGAYYDAAIGGASIAALAEAGWPWQFVGARNKTNVTANPSYLVTSYGDVYGAMTYLIGSSWYQTTTNTDGSIKNVQYNYMMSTYNKSNEKVTVAYGNFLSGASVRCVKDK